MNTELCPPDAAAERRALARAALSDSALFIDHLRRTFTNCVSRFRAGDAAPGMCVLARGLSDLDQFVKLVEAVTVEAPREPSRKDDLKQDLLRCMESLEPVLACQDFGAIADGIEGGLLPLFPIWEATVGELTQMIQ
jgi:hypothetical protein